MMQGDSYGKEFKLRYKDGPVITPDDVMDVEVTIGSLSKTLKKNEIHYDSSLESWIFPISQEESFKFPAARLKSQVRIKWLNGEVEGADLEDIYVEESRSKAVL